ncbi:MAG: hypothetical protein E7098_01715 [Mediterranea massiliensis]|nr:hypothetical protein [Mediterranea massiliensis]MBO5382016.1 hypothetical protein [Bacteroides sp.]MBR4047998.1 hypothetical protein [Bacteroides sp.]
MTRLKNLGILYHLMSHIHHYRQVSATVP